jgi:hypothetical protein
MNEVVKVKVDFKKHCSELSINNISSTSPEIVYTTDVNGQNLLDIGPLQLIELVPPFQSIY